jgi:hypothetical protein
MSLAANSYAFGSLPPSNFFSATSYNAVLLHGQVPTLSPLTRPPHNMPQVREARNGLSIVDQRPTAKAGNGLTLRPNAVFNDMSSRAQPKLPMAAEDVDFGTEVDSLMRAIRPSRNQDTKHSNSSFQHVIRSRLSIAARNTETRIQVELQEMTLERGRGTNVICLLARRASFRRRAEIHMRAHWRQAICRSSVTDSDQEGILLWYDGHC